MRENIILNMVVFSLLKVMTIPTQKGEHSCTCTELSLYNVKSFVKEELCLQAITLVN